MVKQYPVLIYVTDIKNFGGKFVFPDFCDVALELEERVLTKEGMDSAKDLLKTLVDGAKEQGVEVPEPFSTRVGTTPDELEGYCAVLFDLIEVEV